MSMQVTSKPNILNQGSLLKNISSQPVQKQAVPAEVKPSPVEDKSSKKLKIGAFISTLVGVSTAMAFVLRGKGYSLNPSTIFKKPPRTWGLFSAVYKAKEMPLLVGKLAVGSVAGGLVGGAIFDKKENMKAKSREAIIQMVGNILTPLLCVCAGMAGFEKFEPKINQFVEKSISTNKYVKGIPTVLASAISLISGIFIGNKVGNTINEKAFNVKDNRKLKLADMSPHIDDLCVVLSLVAAQSQAGKYISRIVPAALMVAGISIATKKEKPEHLAAEAAVKAAKTPNKADNQAVVK